MLLHSPHVDAQSIIHWDFSLLFWTMSNIPIPSPTVNLPISRTITDEAAAMNTAPTVNTNDAINITIFRPNRTLKNPEVIAPSMAPPTVMLTTNSCNSVDKLKCFLMGIIAPDMTPVS